MKSFQNMNKNFHEQKTLKCESENEFDLYLYFSHVFHFYLIIFCSIVVIKTLILNFRSRIDRLRNCFLVKKFRNIQTNVLSIWMSIFNIFSNFCKLIFLVFCKIDLIFEFRLCEKSIKRKQRKFESFYKKFEMKISNWKLICEFR